MPASRVRAIISCASFSSTLETLAKMPWLTPKVIAPKETRETRSPVSPKRVYCITPIVASGLAVVVRHRDAKALDGLALEIEFDQDGGLIAHDPARMVGFDCDEFGGLEFFDAAIRETDIDLAFGHEADVSVRAKLLTEHGAQMGVPGKAGRVDHAFDTDGAGAGNVDFDAADVVAFVGTDGSEKG